MEIVREKPQIKVSIVVISKKLNVDKLKTCIVKFMVIYIPLCK